MKQSMGKLTVLLHVTLDGVMQAPGRPDEDPRGGFTHGGWARARGDAMGMAPTGMGAGGAMLFGRRTYEGFFAFWPRQAANPYTDALNSATKYVASTTLKEPLPWSNSTLLTGDVPGAVARLKQQLSGDLLIMGSGELVRSLIPHNLIDVYVLMIHPLVLGSGRRLFDEGGPPVELQLVESKTSASGVIVATYQAAQAAQ